MYDDLVREPEATVRALCEAVDLDFHAAMLEAFREVHVAAPGRDDPARTAYSRRHEWDALDPSWVTPEQRAALSALFARFDRALDWPTHFTAGQVPARRTVSDAERTVELETLLAHMKASFERRRLEYEERTRAREAEYAAQSRAREADVARVWNEQRDWIAELERGKAWLQEQVDNWRGEAERLQRGTSD
jgi:hypothetical protein